MPYKRKEDSAAATKRYREKNPDSVREWYLVRNYGIGSQEFNELARAQNGQCAICGDAIEDLVVDHNHNTGAVRGLLCRSCNSGLGLFKDNLERLRGAVRYMEKEKEGNSNVH